MDASLLAVMCCPFCGTGLDLVDNGALVRDGSDVQWGVLGCQCCAFPIVDGIPVLIADDATRGAMHAMEAGQRDEAVARLLGLDTAAAARLFALLQQGAVTYREALEIISPDRGGDLLRLPAVRSDLRAGGNARPRARHRRPRAPDARSICAAARVI